MYNKYLLPALLILFVVSHSVMAQQIQPVDFFNLPHADIKAEFPHKTHVRVKVTNVNRFVYKVNTDKTDTDFNMEVPAVLSGIKLPSFFNLKTPANKAAPAPAPAPGAGASAQTLKKSIQDNVTQLVVIEEYINKAVDVHNKIIYASKSCADSAPVIIKNVIAILKTIVPGNQDSIPYLSARVKDSLELYSSAITGISDAMDSAHSLWSAKVLTDYRRKQEAVKTANANQKNDLAVLQEALKKTGANKKLVDSLIKAKNGDIRGTDAIIANNEEDKGIEAKEIDALVSKAKDLIADIQKFIADGKTYTIVDDINKVNISSYTYYSEEVKMETDEVKFVITASSETPLPCNKPNEQKFTVKLRTRGGVKLDFSTGVFFNFGSNEFQGKDYYYKPVDADHVTIQSADAGKRIGLSLGGLMHIYKRSPDKVKPALSVGASVTTGIDALNFHTGISLLLGDKERFCITAGVTWREIKILDKNYTEGTTYETKLVPDAVSTIKKFPTAGTFISFTYNFSKFNK